MITKPSVTWTPAHSTNYRVGRALAITEITFHHIVGDAAAAINRFQTPDIEVSSHYVIGSDGKIYQMVKDSDTAYTNGNALSNSRSITIEHAGGHPNVPYTEAMYNASVSLVAWLIQEYKISTFKRHRDIVATVCPGTLDVERIIKDAKALQGGVMSVVNDGDTVNHYRAAFGREPTQAEKDKNRGKEWNHPDSSKRAPIYTDMLNQANFLRTENERMAKELAGLAKPVQLTNGIYKVG